ncbi:MAG TPA: hypothetical protein H9751_09165 [Candidatus Corynebacterium faecigallinarum]|uniref:Secreted protein n=1 Tax=Candidatus Corynebacterium faecigallinarum TaxID=2838528 RepID=A0A9D2QEG1_9CORY|nr:hypothetical protein [Candidatus Corynebacterium faecigallinarum]
MKVRKSLISLATVSAVAISGTSIAAAQDEELPAEGSASSSSEGSNGAEGEEGANGSAILGSIQGSTSDGALDPQGSVQADGFFNQIWEDGETGVVSLAGVAAVIAGTAVVAGNVKGIADAYSAVIDASDTYQGVLADTRGFLESQGIL